MHACTHTHTCTRRVIFISDVHLHLRHYGYVPLVLSCICCTILKIMWHTIQTGIQSTCKASVSPSTLAVVVPYGGGATGPNHSHIYYACSTGCNTSCSPLMDPHACTLQCSYWSLQAVQVQGSAVRAVHVLFICSPSMMTYDTHFTTLLLYPGL